MAQIAQMAGRRRWRAVARHGPGDVEAGMNARASAQSRQASAHPGLDLSRPAARPSDAVCPTCSANGLYL